MRIIDKMPRLEVYHATLARSVGRWSFPELQNSQVAQSFHAPGRSLSVWRDEDKSEYIVPGGV